MEQKRDSMRKSRTVIIPVNCSHSIASEFFDRQINPPLLPFLAVKAQVLALPRNNSHSNTHNLLNFGGRVYMSVQSTLTAPEEPNAVSVLRRLTRVLGMAVILVVTVYKSCFAQNLDMARGNYMIHCARCHGESGSDRPVASDPEAKDISHSLNDCSWMKLMSNATLFGIIKNGGQWAGMKDMPAFGSRLTDQQIEELITFIRGFCAQN